MNASETLNKITAIRRSQAFKARVNFLHGLPADPGTKPQSKAQRLAFCGSWVQFREWVESGDSKVVQAMTCKLPFLCEFCAVRRQAKLFAAAIEKVEFVLSARPDLIPAMITLTLKTGPDLREQFGRIASALTKMQKRARESRGEKPRHAPVEFTKVLGQIRSWEVKRGKKPGDWNVHCHLFALLGDYIDRERLRDEWLKFTGDSFIVDVRRVRGKTPDSDAIASGLCEVIKYPLKFSGLPAADAWHVHTTLAGRRMTDCLGELRGVQPGQLDEDEGIEEMEGPYRDFIAQWLWGPERFDVRPVPQALREWADLPPDGSPSI